MNTTNLPPTPDVLAEPDPPARPDADLTETPPSESTRHPRARQGLVAFGAYLLVSFLLYGLPVLRNYASTFVGKGAGDGRIFLWSFAWWPHAFSTGVSPVVTHAIFEPAGLNLAWASSIPGPAILMWPITRAFGPMVSMNLVTLLAPVLAAWGAYLVCRRVSSRFWPALLGGYLFGFSSYMTEQLTGHVNLFFIFPVPLAVYLVIRRIDKTLPVGRFVIGLGLLLVLLFSISTEVFATFAFFGGLALLGALAFAKGQRASMAATIGWTTGGFLVAAFILFPLLTFVLKGAPAGPIRPVIFGTSANDAVSFLIPRQGTLIGGATFRRYTVGTLGSPPEQGAYLPLPIIGVLIAAAWALRRDRIGRLALAFAGIAALFSLGTYLHVGGQQSIPLPWTPFAHLPILQDALPSRFTMFAWLGIAVVAARWMDRTEHPWRRVGVVALGAVMLLPNIALPAVHTPLEVPAFFSDPQDYRRYIPEDHTIAYVHSDKGGEMLAQIQAHFWFRLAQGHTGPTPVAFRGLAYHAIDSGDPTGLTPPVLRAFLLSHKVSTVVLADGLAGSWDQILHAATGANPVAIGGVHVYAMGPLKRAPTTHGSTKPTPGN